MAKASAPRKKPVIDKAPGTPRGTKLSTSAKVCNKDKFNTVARMLDRVMALKQKMSEHVRSDLLALFLDSYAVKKEGYKAFSGAVNQDLNAWETQALHHDICSDYQRKLASVFARSKFSIQTGFVFSVYQRTVTKKEIDGSLAIVARPGDVKPGTFEIVSRQTPLTSAANFLLRCNLAEFDPLAMKLEHPMREKLVRIMASPRWPRLAAVVQARQLRLVGKVSTIQYHTGTHRRNVLQSRGGLSLDAGNAKHQVFLQVRVGLGKEAVNHRLPMLFNPGRLKIIAPGGVIELMQASEYRLKCTGRKIHCCTTYPAAEPRFAAQEIPEKAIGLDVNSKHNLLARDDGSFYSLPQLYFDGLLALLGKIDMAGGTSCMHWRRKAQLAKALRRNEAQIQKLLKVWLDGWQLEGVTDIWMEDLALSNDATFIRHAALGEKYSRVTRLLRLSAVKGWIASMAEKRSMRVHTTNAAYTSQECPNCHHVSRGNRLTQERFVCEACQFEGNADTVAAWNIKNRGASEVLRSLLHTFDSHQRASPNDLSRPALKRLLMAQGAQGT